MEIRWERVTGGWLAYSGALKLAVLESQHHQGVLLHGGMVYEPMPRASWKLHWTSPSMHVDVIAAVMASLPTEG